MRVVKIVFTTIMTMWQPQPWKYCCSIVVGALSACMILDKMVCMMVGIVINLIVGVMFGKIVGLVVGIVVWAFACLHDGWRPYKELIACLVTPTFDSGLSRLYIVCLKKLFLSLMRSSTSKNFRFLAQDRAWEYIREAKLSVLKYILAHQVKTGAVEICWFLSFKIMRNYV